MSLDLDCGRWPLDSHDGTKNKRTRCNCWGKIQTFNADFTTARMEHTGRNGTVGMHNREED